MQSNLCLWRSLGFCTKVFFLIGTSTIYNTNITYSSITNNTSITYNTNTTYNKITITYPYTDYNY